MKLTTKGRYAIIAMVDLSLNGAVDPVRLKDIATRQNISLSYLEQLFSKLRLSGLVKSVRGPGGGYILSQTASEINLLDVITAVDEKIDQTQCGGAMNCINEKPCLTHFIWTDLNEIINQYMQGINLGDIALREDVRNIIFLRENKNVSHNQRQEK
ncbi:MAG: Rrf2 family transcriptional regulator [Gammaproteobacteria bacterium]|jgi:Rrf2 family transcriptional regulator, iron-sulfur cluster assembly transcription factor|nr:Rrf2 family transcriptional regulator [Gammaproteobacteria bacterium]MBT5406098.1 Rrf2 family transcriptional regulator [Gammaproteobacteria bacterium]MBT5644463.1 Rrf2 family transcriptional regulator [Gammaproteobacteria bacterium]MBT5863717.1 Rrf2 family transcriptional regulator [Gammaproteobacteria bacterium]MBT6734002.1 Rrf2 family transcriptional regulator [Gammaproteobacteria bacterium]|tara:strand:- start:517 stop:984 length:468 start_codon:yes stop_codon:yes gene_type:complete